jgi:hypothetical protein
VPGFSSFDVAHGTLIHSTSAVNCVKGVIGGTIAGAANDTLLLGVYIPLHAATASTMTITGLAGEDGTQRSWLLSGQTAVDSWYLFDYPILNDAAAFTFTASVADSIVVFTRAYTGGQ